MAAAKPAKAAKRVQPASTGRSAKTKATKPASTGRSAKTKATKPASTASPRKRAQAADSTKVGERRGENLHALIDEVERHLAEVEASRRRAYDDLERRIRERTRELEHANVTLQAELSARKEAQESLRASEKRIRTLASEAAMAEQRERKQLASGLHEGLGQLLALAGMRLDAIAHFDRVDAAALREIRAILSQAQELGESLTFQLSPPVLDDVGLVAACQWLGEEIARIYEFGVTIDAEREHRWSDEAVSATVFRAVREFLINAAQHSRARKAVLHFHSAAPHLHITVEDGGIGFDPAEAKGFGMSNAAERLRYLGGEVEIDSAPGKGTRIQMTVPLETESDRTRKAASRA